MPKLPAKLCSFPGCTTPCRARRCERHSGRVEGVDAKAWATTTTSSTARGYGAKWQRLRKVILARDPVCRICGRSWSTTVDHITPKAKEGTDDERNLRGVCQPCHDAKTAQDAASARRAKRGERGGQRGQSARPPGAGGARSRTGGMGVRFVQRRA